MQGGHVHRTSSAGRTGHLAAPSPLEGWSTAGRVRGVRAPPCVGGGRGEKPPSGGDERGPWPWGTGAGTQALVDTMPAADHAGEWGSAADEMDMHREVLGRVAQAPVPGPGARDSAQAPVGVGGQDREKRVEGAVGEVSGEASLHLGGAGTGVQCRGHGHRYL